MSEKDYRATYFKSLGMKSMKTDVIDIDADELNLDKIKHYLLETPSNKVNNRPQIWQFLLGIIPRYKTVRVHTQEQLAEQWSVVEKTARLILSISSDHDTVQYLFALHLIQTGQLSLMNDTEEISSGNVEADNAHIILIKHILIILNTLKLQEQYFIIHEILLLFSSINRNDSILQKISSKILLTEPGISRKLHSPEVKDCLSKLVRTCFSTCLPACCFERLMDCVIARRSTACLVAVGVDIIKKNAVVNKNLAPTALVEGLESTRLITQPHESCMCTYIST